ncbi:hypothetical protein PGTUg99_015888 [Puccinia graminis f. sp. tritici]|uniref:CCHC-type domain-containing protein n=1 Tax=Puccinia graminis f. sp. tritici TaxID=56615 RepID=A0A5B0MCS6_PUCGR|nr:hypothetical protein PGTUg99_015888 [Puccinia graminis f. sp. tritici]
MKEVDWRVEQDLGGSSRTLSKKAVTPNQILKHVDIVKCQIDLGSSRSSFSTMVPQVHQASTDNNSDLAKEFFNPESWSLVPPAVEGLASHGLQCWNCRSPDHLLSKCKLPRRRDFDCPPTLLGQFCRQWPSSTPTGPNNPPMMAPNNFQAWYPIVTPPGYSSQGYRAAQSPYAPLSNHANNAFGNRRPDLYRPDNRQRSGPPPSHRPPTQSAANLASTLEGYLASDQHPPGQNSPPIHQSQDFQEPTARMIEIGAFDEALEHGLVPGFSQITVGEGEDPVIDSGATHHLTANSWGPLFSEPEWANHNS